MVRVRGAEALGDEDVEGLTTQLAGLVAEHARDLRVGEDDGAGAVDDEECVGRLVEEVTVEIALQWGRLHAVSLSSAA